jgi:hypothetical protein
MVVTELNTADTVVLQKRHTRAGDATNAEPVTVTVVPPAASRSSQIGSECEG